MAATKYYVAGTGTDGSQLWVVTVNGQDVSSAELADVYPATQVVLPVPGSPGQYALTPQANDGAPNQFTNFGGGTLFVASGLHTGRELFITDGTAAGTHLVRDLTPAYDKVTYRSHRISYTKYTNVQSSDPTGITAVGANLAVFTANDGTHAAELFTTDGTSAGTTALTTGGLYGASYITGFGASALFAGVSTADAGVTQLWVTDGTAVGTHALTGPTAPGVADTATLNAPGNGLTVVATASGGAEAFFAGTTAGAGTELWVSDGTQAGTHQVADIDPGAGSSHPAFITALGVGRAIFAADDGTSGVQLWSTDGTTAGTSLVKAINPGGATAFTSDFHGFTTAVIGGRTEAFFVATDGAQADPWVTDGTAAGTQRLFGYANSYAGNFTAFDGKMFFTADDGTHGRELWVSDGTVAGTTLFDDIDPGAAGSSPSGLHVLGSELVFQADGGSGATLWETDGTLAGTHAVTGQGNLDLTTLSTDPVPCFARGTRLAGPDGPVAVEDVREGDLLLTHSGAAVPVVWVGSRHIACDRHPRPRAIWPVRVRTGAFGAGVPSADVVVSPDHAILVEDALVPARLLVNGCSIVQERVAQVEYFHVELPLHDVLIAEGLPVESYLDTGNRDMFEGQPTLRLHADFARLDWENACAPLALAGPVVARARAMTARAAA